MTEEWKLLDQIVLKAHKSIASVMELVTFALSFIGKDIGVVKQKLCIALKAIIVSGICDDDADLKFELALARNSWKFRADKLLRSPKNPPLQQIQHHLHEPGLVMKIPPEDYFTQRLTELRDTGLQWTDTAKQVSADVESLTMLLLMAPKVAKGKGPAVDPLEELRDQILALHQSVEAIRIQQESLAVELERRHAPRLRPECVDNHVNPTFKHVDFSDVSNEDTISMVNIFHHDRHTPPEMGGGPRWEQGFRIEILEFTGSLDPAEFLDWLHITDDIMEFIQVSEDRRVGLIATRFRGRATAWWQQIRATRARQGRSKISSWPKLQKHLRREFLPFNYRSTLFQSIHNLRQGTYTVADYSEDFHQLLARVDMNDSQDQLAARYIADLKPTLQDTLNLFGPTTLAEAQQRAAQLEKQQAQRLSSSPVTSYSP
ncbi:hypothetical protein OROHE_010096 [Orobanche hederae]